MRVNLLTGSKATHKISKNIIARVNTHYASHKTSPVKSLSKIY